MSNKNATGKRNFLLMVPARQPTQKDVDKMCKIFPTWQESMAPWSEYKFGWYKTVGNALKKLVKHRIDMEAGKDKYLAYRIEAKRARIIDVRTGENILTTKKKV